MDWTSKLSRMKPATRDRILGLKRLMEEGVTETQAWKEMGWNNYRAWRTFKDRHDLNEHLTALREANEIRSGKKSPVKRSLESFCDGILGMPLYPHMAEWRDWMEDPEASHILIVTRPDSGKSSFLRNYSLWRIAEDPTIRITYSSGSEKHATRQVSLCRGVLESNTSLQRAYGHFKPTQDQRYYPWGNERFLVGQRRYTPGEAEADETMKAIGLGGHIAGIRSDLFIVDDPDGKQHSPLERYQFFDAITTVVEDRLTVGGKLVVLANRWDVKDVAGFIQQMEAEEPGLWRIHTTPAIKRWPNKEDPDDWGEVLWPERFGSMSNKVGDRWTHKRAWLNVFDRLKRLRARGEERKFHLMYQNDPVGDSNRDFTEEVIQKATERGRDLSWGKVPENSLVLCALDPAGTGGAAVLCVAVLPNGKWQLVDARWGKNLRSAGMHEWMREFGRYGPTYWVIEGQGPWKEWADSREIKDICAEQAAQRIVLSTGENKYKKDIGISSLVPEVAERLIIPSKELSDRDQFKQFIYQMSSYRVPEVMGTRIVESTEPYDLLMAFWFAARVIRDRNLTPSPNKESKNYWKPKYPTNWQGGSWRLRPQRELVTPGKEK